MVEAAGSKFKLHNTGKLSNAATKEALSSDWASLQTITSRQHRMFSLLHTCSVTETKTRTELTVSLLYVDKCCHEVYLPAMQMSFFDS